MGTTPPADRDNNVGAIRLVLALLVLYSHSYPLARNVFADELSELTGGWYGGLMLSEAAVDGFFVLSGFLIVRSWQSHPDAGAFLTRRAARILPGYWVAVAFSMAVAAASADHPAGYLRRVLESGDGMVRAALFLEPAVINRSEAFPRNPNHSVNSSLWTLQPEFRCYMLVLALGMAGRLRGMALPTVALAVAVTGYAYFTFEHGRKETWPSYWRLLTAFGTGLWLACRTPADARIGGGWWGVAAAAAGLVAAVQYPPAFVPAFPVCGGYLLLRAAFARPALAPGWFARNDLSYGVYLYAFPVQQAVVHVTRVDHPWLLTALALPPVLGLAALSWRLVERPCLRAARRTGPPKS